jgi:hypothetical protein
MSIANGPFRDSRVPFWLSGPRPNIPAEPLSHRSYVQSYKTVHVYYYGIIKIKHMFMFILYDQLNKRWRGVGNPLIG